MSENDEHNCVERARRGERTAVAELYQRYWRAARAAAYGVTGDFSLAEDAASEAFCAALDGLADLREDRCFGPWLRTIVIRTARRFRTAAARQHAPASKTAHELPAPGADLERQELAALVHEAVRSLPQTLREAVSLYYFEGYSIEQAARFLDVPAGTVKRRLHDGRRRLQAAAGQIAQGSKPMSEERERILQQLREAAEQGPDSEAFYQMMRKAAKLGPLPEGLFRDIWKRHLAARESQGEPLIPPKREEAIREGLRRLHEPSERARDPSHPVGAVAKAIREALPTFRPWQVDVSSIDLNSMARKLCEDRAQAVSYLLPPGFLEESSGSYVSAERAPLIEDHDGSVLTMNELIEKKTAQEAFRERMIEGSRLSDALKLAWKQPDPLELQMVQELLRDLAERIVPGVPLRFLPRQAPQFRAGLRMELGNSPIPAAIGGVVDRRTGLPEGTHLASVTIYLEPWASAHSGQAVELVRGSPFPWRDKDNRADT